MSGLARRFTFSQCGHKTQSSPISSETRKDRRQEWHVTCFATVKFRADYMGNGLQAPKTKSHPQIPTIMVRTAAADSFQPRLANAGLASPYSSKLPAMTKAKEATNVRPVTMN